MRGRKPSDDILIILRMPLPLVLPPLLHHFYVDFYDLVALTQFQLFTEQSDSVWHVLTFNFEIPTSQNEEFQIHASENAILRIRTRNHKKKHPQQHALFMHVESAQNWHSVRAISSRICNENYPRLRTKSSRYMKYYQIHEHNDTTMLLARILGFGGSGFGCWRF